MFGLDIVLSCVGLGWVAYNLYRVRKEPRNAVEVGAQVVARCPRPFAFQTYMKVREYYLQLSDGHRRYEMNGTHLAKDLVIDVWETAGFQFVKHRYRVTELVPNKRMSLLSECSEVRVLGVFKGHSRSEVEFRFDDQPSGGTTLGLTIRIVFANHLRHLLARLFFTEAIWAAHARQEMTALARIMEQRQHEEQMAGVAKPV